jgi:DNA-binding XRE family transcriptional regulator
VSLLQGEQTIIPRYESQYIFSAEKQNFSLEVGIMGRKLTKHDGALTPHAVDMVALGRLVRNSRAQLNLTLVDAVEEMGVSKSALSRLENGKAINLDLLFTVLRNYGLHLLVIHKGETRDALRAVKQSQTAAMVWNHPHSQAGRT